MEQQLVHLQYVHEVHIQIKKNIIVVNVIQPIWILDVEIGMLQIVNQRKHVEQMMIVNDILVNVRTVIMENVKKNHQCVAQFVKVIQNVYKVIRQISVRSVLDFFVVNHLHQIVARCVFLLVNVLEESVVLVLVRHVKKRDLVVDHVEMTVGVHQAVQYVVILLHVYHMKSMLVKKKKSKQL